MSTTFNKEDVNKFVSTKSGSLYGLSFTLGLFIDSFSQSVANNTTTIVYKLYLIAKSSNYSISGISGASIGGTSLSSVSSSYSNFSTSIGGKSYAKQIGDKITKVYSHASDGSKQKFDLTYKITLSGSTGISYTISDISVPAIPRTASINTCSITNVTPSGGGKITIKLNNTSSSLTYKLTMSDGIYSSKSISSYFSEDIRKSLLQKHTGSSANIKCTVDTYSGSTKIGSVSKTINISLEAKFTNSVSIIVNESADNIDKTKYTDAYINFFKEKYCNKRTLSISGINTSQDYSTVKYYLYIDGIKYTEVTSNGEINITLKKTGANKKIYVIAVCRGATLSGKYVTTIKPYKAVTTKTNNISISWDTSTLATTQFFTDDEETYWSMSAKVAFNKKISYSNLDSTYTKINPTITVQVQKNGVYKDFIIDKELFDINNEYTFKITVGTDNIFREEKIVLTIKPLNPLLDIQEKGIGVDGFYDETRGGPIQISNYAPFVRPEETVSSITCYAHGFLTSNGKKIYLQIPSRTFFLGSKPLTAFDLRLVIRHGADGGGYLLVKGTNDYYALGNNYVTIRNDSNSNYETWDESTTSSIFHQCLETHKASETDNKSHVIEDVTITPNGGGLKLIILLHDSAARNTSSLEQLSAHDSGNLKYKCSNVENINNVPLIAEIQLRKIRF